jgi:apolipoprotein N-acyltransferase
LRSLGTYGFTWGGLAYSQADNLAAVQMVSLTGPWGLSFAIVLVSVALAAERNRRFLPLLIAAAVAATVHIGGSVALHRQVPTQGDILVALVQGSIDQDLVLTRERRLETVDAYTSLTSSAAAARPDFIVWPETVVPGNLITSEPMRDWISNLARMSQAHMLVGAPRDQPATESTPAMEMNGAYMFGPDGELLGSYYKVHLVPFGEFVPGRNRLPFLERYRVREVDVMPGDEYNLLPAATGDVGVMICFESIFPRIGRTMTRDGANLLFVITNDGWFKRSAAAAQHHDFSIFRAVENRRFVVRNAATGISSIIDPYGRVQDNLEIWEKGVLYGDVDTRTDLTVYSRFGDWFAYLCFVIAAIGVAAGTMEQRQRKRGPRRTRKHR